MAEGKYRGRNSRCNDRARCVPTIAPTTVPKGIIVPILLVLIVIVGVIALAIFLHRQEQKRRRALRAWAAGHRFTFSAAKDKTLADRFDGFGILHRGHSRHAKNVVSGTHNDRPLWAFDYSYTTGSGRNRRTHRFSAVVIKCAHPLIPLTIRREHLFDRVGEFIGLDDIDFESAEFSRRFYVKSPDRRWAYDVIHATMMEFLLEHCNASVEFDGWHVMAHRRRRFSPSEFDSTIRLIEGIFTRIPTYVVRQLTGQDRSGPDSAELDQRRADPGTAKAPRRRS